MKTKLKDKINWKQLIIIIVCVALVAALTAVLVVAFSGNKEDSDGYIEVTPKFTIGGLADDGSYDDTKGSLYTKDAISAQSVKVTLEFDSTVRYQLFFYDEFDEFVSSVPALGKGSEVEVPDGATAFRIELTPIWDDDVEKDDQKVTVFNKGSYIKQLTVKIIELEEAEELPDPDAT